MNVKHSWPTKCMYYVNRYNKVNVLATFDSTGAIKYHLHGVRGREKPHFTETGQNILPCIIVSEIQVVHF